MKVLIPIVVVVAAAAAFLWPRLSNEVSWFASVKGDTVERSESLPFVALAYPIPEKTGTEASVEINAKSAIVVDRESGEVLYEKNPDDVHPIASISKLASLNVFLEYNPGWEERMSLTAEENTLSGAKLREQPGEDMRVIDVYTSALVGSVNNGTWALMRVTGLSQEEYAAEMNRFVRELGLEHSYFEEPTGLSEANVSTARELVALVDYTMNVPEMVPPLRQKTHDFFTVTSGKFHSVKSSNRILDQDLDVVMSKTGFTYEAYYTLASVFRGPAGQELIVVTLGSETDPARISDTLTLVDWVLDEYTWKE